MLDYGCELLVEASDTACNSYTWRLVETLFSVFLFFLLHTLKNLQQQAVTQCFYHCFMSHKFLFWWFITFLQQSSIFVCYNKYLQEVLVGKGEKKKKAAQELSVIKCTLAQWSPVCGKCCIERAITDEENFFPVLQKDAARLSKNFCIVYEALNSSEEVKKEAAGLIFLSKALCNLLLSSTFSGKLSSFLFLFIAL